MLNKEHLIELSAIISGCKNIVLTTHTNPDGDAIGSTMALFHFFIRKGYQVSAIVPNEFPGFLAWIPGSENMMIFEKDSKKTQIVLENADVVFCLDYNALSRVGSMTESLKKVKAPRILIDHHIEPETESFACIYSTVHVSSTSEMVYNLIEQLNGLELIDKIISECLYAGIVTDTGSFSFSSNKSSTYRIIADLIERGLVPDKIHQLIYDTFSENRLRLLGLGINDRMLVWNELRTALIYFTAGDLANFDEQVGDTEGVVNYPLSMEKINLSILLTEREKNIRISFRSKGSFSVNDLARKHFSGGGHLNAAGGKSFKSMDITIENIKSVLKKYKKNLDYQINYS